MIRNYLQKLNQPEFEPLTPEREKELAEQLQNALDSNNFKKIELIHEELINRQIRLVLHIAKNFKGKIEWEDLVSAGIMGLVAAVKRWQPSKGVLYHWSVRWITTAIIKEIDHTRTIRIPERKAREAAIIRNEIKAKEEVLMRSLTQAEIKDIIGDRVDITELPLGELVLDQPVYNNDNIEFTIKDTILDNSDDVHEIVEKKLINDSLHKAIEELTEIERLVISYRFGLNNERLTLAEMGEKFNMTGEGIRRIEVTALAKLRHPAIKNPFSFEEL
jgi:RNA polymerase primary sigma factor